jgi:integrase
VVTPPTPRHTYISIPLLVTDNVPYVMEQVGHDDETTTTRIYPHLIRRRQEQRSGVRPGRRAGACGLRRRRRTGEFLA